MKPKVREAKQTHLIAASLGLLAVFIFAADASAYYHPTLGRFMSRDPGSGGPVRIGAGGPAVAGGFIPRDQYVDGMNLYQYVRSNSLTYVDPFGDQATRPSDSTRELAMQRCEAKLDALKALINGDKGAVGKFARCAKKRGTLDVDKMGCVYDLPNSVESDSIAWYDPSSGAIKINARVFASTANGAGNYWGTFLHELTHAVDGKTTFDNNECLDSMIREARAYWRMDDKCSCEAACERAWGSARYGCYISEAFQPSWNAWRKQYGSSSSSQPASRPQFTPPDQATWYQNNQDKWVKACKAKCNDGPLRNNRSVDADCDAELSAQ
ncbi:MAG: hypothetical protein GXY38_02160 [Planctomycetes bacterium]|nr:hypothetical protein [Planctomycetota bacterium]